MKNKKNTVLFVMSLILLALNFIFLKNGAEDIISGHALAGTLDAKYLSSEGWAFDYGTINAHYAITLVFVTLFYLLRFKEAARGIGKVLIAVYLAAEIIAIAIFPALWMLIGAQAALFTLLAAISFSPAKG